MTRRRVVVPLDEWRHILTEFSGVWAAAATVAELHDDKQVLDNGFLPEVPVDDGSNFRVVAPRYHFDLQPSTPRRPPG